MSKESPHTIPLWIDPITAEYLATAIAQILIEGLSTDETALLGSFVTSIGQTMLRISAQSVLRKKCLSAAEIALIAEAEV